MVLYDRMDPPLPAGEYTLRVSTEVSLAGATLPADVRHFNVEGPRFTLAPTEVAGVFPPRNARGAFSDALPHITFGRRTLPWERTADPAGALPLPPADGGAPPRPGGAPPWLALLLFDETEVPEATVLTDQPVSEVLPAAVRRTLSPAPPADARCDCVEASAGLLKEILPTVEELHLLTHVRQVNIEDRELSANDSDGWFSVVVSNRVPQRNRKYRACLVSLEGRTDLLTNVEPPVASDFFIGPVFELLTTAATDTVTPARPVVTDATPGLAFNAADLSVPSGGVSALGLRAGVEFLPPQLLTENLRYVRRERLVLLHTWLFECKGGGTFQQLAENVDVGLIGEVRGDFPKVADTGHLPVEMRDRAGSPQTAWYRGPLVPFPVTRDTRGPYHSADQARRVSPETGLEEITYAAAFEVGRLLAAADGRLAQELMRWRRGDFRSAVELTMKDLLGDRFPALVGRLSLDVVARVLVHRWIDPRVRVFDPLELATIAAAPGLDAARLAQAWGLPVDRTQEILSPQLVALAAPVEATQAEVSTALTLEAVSRDLTALGRLAGARARTVEAALRLSRERGGLR
jgi:hypothetical protein